MAKAWSLAHQQLNFLSLALIRSITAHLMSQHFVHLETEFGGESKTFVARNPNDADVLVSLSASFERRWRKMYLDKDLAFDIR